jgi:pyruvate,water dikinase
VVNDVFIMMGLGFLSRAVAAKGVDEEAVIDLLKTDDGVDSVKPLEHFNQLIGGLDEGFLREFAGLDLAIGFSPYGELFRVLRERGYGTQTDRVADFIERYGDRSFEELKLESLPLRNNPRLLADLMLWCKRNPVVTGASAAGPKAVDLGFLGNRVLRFTREAISMREATRLWRGKFYHLLRQMVLALAARLMETDPAWREFDLLDFFSLTPAEWSEFSVGRLAPADARELLRERRGWKEKKRPYPEVIAWVADEPLPEPSAAIPGGSLAGLGVSPGVAEGVALVLENPRDVLGSDLTDFILVTKNTDPAWVYIMSRSRGLVSEKGSLLSHTAIIGRELNIPTVVGVREATQKIKTGDRLRLDAVKGTIEVL